MGRIAVKLPEKMQSYVDEQTVEPGYRDASQFVQSLIEADRYRRLKEEIELSLLAAVKGPAEDFTKADFDDIRREGKRIIAKRRTAKTARRGAM